MYWYDMKDCFSEVLAAKERGIDEIYYLSEKCRERLFELLDNDGILILEKYIACLDLINKKADFIDHNTYSEE